MLEGSHLWRIDGCWSPALWSFSVMVDALITEHMKRCSGQCRPWLHGGWGFVSGLPPRRCLWERYFFHIIYHRKKRAFSTAGMLMEIVAGFLRSSCRLQQLFFLCPLLPSGNGGVRYFLLVTCQSHSVSLRLKVLLKCLVGIAGQGWTCLAHLSCLWGFW